MEIRKSGLKDSEYRVFGEIREKNEMNLKSLCRKKKRQRLKIFT